MAEGEIACNADGNGTQGLPRRGPRHFTFLLQGRRSAGRHRTDVDSDIAKRLPLHYIVLVLCHSTFATTVTLTHGSESIITYRLSRTNSDA